MAAFQGDPSLLISSLLRYAATQAVGSDLGKAWLIAAQNAYRIAWMANDEYATNVGMEGANTTWMREIPANLGDQLCESALQQLDFQLANPGAGPLNQVRGIDYSGAPSCQG